MGESQLFQSSFRRAVADTIHAPRRNPWFFWSIGIVMAALGGFLGTVYTPEGSGSFISAVYPTAGVILGAIIGIIIIFIINLILAPYRQRDEARTLLQAKPKPKPLSNREALLKAIMDVQNSAMELFTAQETVDDNVNWMSEPSARNAVSQAYQKHRYSLQELEKELIVAGEAYELCVLRFKTFVQGQIYLKMVKPAQVGGDEEIALGKYKFPAQLGERVKEAIRSINEISGQVPDKEGSQTE